MPTNGKSSSELKRIKWLRAKRDCKSMNRSNRCARKTPQRRTIMTTRISNIRGMIVGSGQVQLRATRGARKEKARVSCLSAGMTTISTRMIQIWKRKPSRRVTLTRSTTRSCLLLPPSSRKSLRRTPVLRPCARLRTSSPTKPTVIRCRPMD